MGLVNILNIKASSDPCDFLDPLEFDITFECIEPLEHDLEWRVVYVGSAENEEYDQVLDSVIVGPVPEGINTFVLKTDPPRHKLIPESEILGVTVIFIACIYLDKEFARVGYYVYNDYEDQNLRENPPEHVEIDKIKRNLLAEKPRVTEFNIEWKTSNKKDEYVQSQEEDIICYTENNVDEDYEPDTDLDSEDDDESETDGSSSLYERDL